MVALVDSCLLLKSDDCREGLTRHLALRTPLSFLGGPKERGGDHLAHVLHALLVLHKSWWWSSNNLRRFTFTNLLLRYDFGVKIYGKDKNLSNFSVKIPLSKVIKSKLLFFGRFFLLFWRKNSNYPQNW